MFTSRVSPLARSLARSASSGTKVAVLGAAGGIGQPLSTFMMINPLVSRLSLYDVVRTPGVACDLSHIDTACKIEGYQGQENLGKVLEGSNVVIIPAGVPRKPGMTRDDLFNTNAGIAFGLAEACAQYCPEACVLVICNPVNSTVPIFSEVMKKRGVHDPRKIMGVTELDSVRARRFLAESLNSDDPKKCNIPVIGGHAGTTIIPLISQVAGDKSKLDIPALTHRIQFGGDEVVAAKEGTGSATLSMAYAGAIFAESVIRGLNGEKGIIEPAYIEQDLYGCSYFASQVELGKDGIERVLPVPTNITPAEKKNIEEAVPQLIGQIEKGIAFAKTQFSK